MMTFYFYTDSFKNHEKTNDTTTENMQTSVKTLPDSSKILPVNKRAVKYREMLMISMEPP